MKHRMFKFLARLSLVVCVASVPLWVWSIFGFYVVAIDIFGHHAVYLGADSGSVYFSWAGPRSFAHVGGDWFFEPTRPSTSMRGHLGFSFTMGDDGEALFVPFWFIMIIAAGTWWWLRVLIKQNSYRPGICVSCGYDLRATPERCPECGTIPTAVTEETKHA